MGSPYLGDRQLDPDDEPCFYCADCDCEFYSLCDLESHREHCDTVPNPAKQLEESDSDN